MSRRLFGAWGIKLDDDAFAQALAALGVVEGSSVPFAGDPDLDAELRGVPGAGNYPARFLAAQNRNGGKRRHVQY